MGAGDVRRLDAIQEAFNRLAAETPTDLSGLYADDVVFVDPAHRVEGQQVPVLAWVVKAIRRAL